jgi:hypothetical protein
MLRAHYCMILAKIGMGQQILVKLPNINIHENSFRDSRVVEDRHMTEWTDT